MARRVYHVVDGLEEAPSLRPKSPLARPLTRTVKGIAMFLGAMSTLVGSLMGAGRWVLKTADIATNASVSAQIAGIESRRLSDAAVDAKNRAADKAERDALVKEWREWRETLHRPRKVPH